MEIVELVDQSKLATIQEWKSKGLSDDSRESLEGSFSSTHTWYAVRNEGTTLVVFEIRRVLSSYIKNMEIFLSPVFNWDEGTSAESVERSIDTLVASISIVFDKLAKEAKRTADKIIKIHSQNSIIYTVFYAFAKQLNQIDRVKYGVKFYKNWVEVCLS